MRPANRPLSDLIQRSRRAARAFVAEDGSPSEAPDQITADNIVWIFGFGRSGNTWLRSMMTEPRGRQLWEEPLIGQLFGHFYRFWGDEDRRTNREDFVLGSRSDFWIGAVRVFVLERVRAQFSAQDGSILIVKEPNGSIGAPLLGEALPESRFVLLIRDPRDVMASLADMAGDGAWGPETFGDAMPEFDLEVWLEEYTMQLERGKKAYDSHRGPKILVRYEDLVDDPARVLRRIHQELGLPLSEAELSDAVEKHAWKNIPEDQKGPGKFNRKATPGAWKEDLTPAQLAAIERVGGPVIAEFYPEP